jgi:hypothetical protein
MKEDCYKCKFREKLIGDAHSQCTNKNPEIKIIGNLHGIKNGWFYWPFNYDPVWLESCNFFEEKEKGN